MTHHNNCVRTDSNKRDLDHKRECLIVINAISLGIAIDN